MKNLSYKLDNIMFENCLINASGCWCRTQHELEDLYNSAAGGIISKTCSLEHRNGNPEPRYYDNALGSINSMGLPNFGHKYYINLYEIFTQKPYIISVSGENINNINQILNYIQEKSINSHNLVEINMSCPNIEGSPQIAYQPNIFNEYLHEINTVISRFSKLIIGLKLPPYFDPVHIKETFNIIKKYSYIRFLTSINSLGNGLIINSRQENTTIHPKMGLGGIGGDYCKPIGLSNIWQFYQLIKEYELNIILIGCGGIKTGRDVFEYILAGASLVQIGTHLLREGPNCFTKIQIELFDIMEKKGYNTLDDFKGKLKILKKD